MSFSHPFRRLILPMQHKAKVQKGRKEEREEMLKTIYADRRSKGIWLFGFLRYAPVSLTLAIRVYFQLQGFQKCAPRLPAIHSTVLNRLFLGLLKYEQHLEQVDTGRGHLSCTSLSTSCPCSGGSNGCFKREPRCRTYARRRAQQRRSNAVIRRQISPRP